MKGPELTLLVTVKGVEKRRSNRTGTVVDHLIQAELCTPMS